MKLLNISDHPLARLFHHTRARLFVCVLGFCEMQINSAAKYTEQERWLFGMIFTWFSLLSLFSSLHCSHNASGQLDDEKHHVVMAAARTAQRDHPRLRATLLWEGKMFVCTCSITGFIFLSAPLSGFFRDLWMFFCSCVVFLYNTFTSEVHTAGLQVGQTWM